MSRTSSAFSNNKNQFSDWGGIWHENH